MCSNITVMGYWCFNQQIGTNIYCSRRDPVFSCKQLRGLPVWCHMQDAVITAFDKLTPTECMEAAVESVPCVITRDHRTLCEMLKLSRCFSTSVIVKAIWAVLASRLIAQGAPRNWPMGHKGRNSRPITHRKLQDRESDWSIGTLNKWLDFSECLICQQKERREWWSWCKKRINVGHLSWLNPPCWGPSMSRRRK